jgi:tetratricopeptide (TPR) repeat protein
MLGEIHRERYRLFRERRELERAVAAYEHVIEKYPRSAFADDALVHLADIHYYNLDDSRGAYALYRRVVERYPGGDNASRARIRTVAIEHRHPEYAARPGAGTGGPEPVSGWDKPLSSPGAVTGGGVQRARTSLPGAPVDRAQLGRQGALGAPSAPAAARAVEAAPQRTPEDETLHPLLQEGPIPLKGPSDDLPPLRSLRPRS